MAKNKIITSQGNVQFINSKGKSINMHPMHCYAVYENDTVSFLFIYMKDYSGQAFFASQYEDLEVNGESYDNIEDLKDAITEAFAKAGAQARTEIVDELPETGFTNTIYLVKKVHGSGYDEYVYTEEGEWELIGDTDIEFERYLKIVDFEAYSSATEVKIDTISGDVESISGDVITLSGALDTEIAAREAADSVISGAVDTVTADLASEVSRALSAEAALGGRIDTVSNRIDAEQIARAAADAVISSAVDTVSGAVDTEVTRAEAAEAALSGAIDTNAADIDALESALADEVSARTNADTALQSQISTVSGAVQTVASDLTYEVNRAEAAEGVLSGAIDTVSGDVVSEISRAEAAEAAIDAKVDTLSGEVQTLGDDKAEKAEAVASAVYVSSSTTIDLMNISGEVISQVDATDFVVDGMVDEVKIENGYLVIVWNTDAGKQETRIPLTDIFDPDNYYDKDDIDDIVSGLNENIDTKLAINDFNTYSGAVETELGNKFDASAITAYSTSLEVTAEIDAATSGKADIEDVYFKSEIDDIVSGLNDSIDTKADLSALTEDERVWGEALNDINSRINDISGDVLTSGDVQTQIDNSISGKADADDVYTKDEVDGLIGDFVTGEELCSKVDECISGTYVSYEGLYDAVYDQGFIDGDTFDSYTGGTDARFDEIETSLNSKANAEDVQSDLGTKVDNEEFIAYSASVETRLTEDEEVTAAGLNALDGVVSAHTANTNVHVTSAEKTTWNEKQNALVAGSGITISGNVISANAQPITVDSSLNNGSTNPVQNQALFNELRVSSSTEVERTLLQWDNTSGSGVTTNYPIGASKIEVTFESNVYTEQDFHFVNSHSQGHYEGFLFVEYEENEGEWYINDTYHHGVSWEISGNVITIDYSEIAANVDHIELIQPQQNCTVEAFGGITLFTPLIDKVAEDEEVTAAALNNINDKFDGLKLKKISQTDYDNLQTKDSNTLYIVI